ncbi:hypothetical protein [uncultured Clostridium sp.]|uniref:hypothetical protein n=1 Tax=uncultured Clostridium sp. TaxID=59620 RepID=UPI00261D55C2|nr:hypothetical protein [uncultured Clostridium sp.]
MNLIENEIIRTDIGNIIRYSGKLRGFIDEHRSISEDNKIEYLGTIVAHSEDPYEILREKDKVNGREVYSLGTFIGGFKTINFNDGTFIFSDSIEVIETPEGCKFHINESKYSDLYNKIKIPGNENSTAGRRAYLFYALENKVREGELLKGIIQNDPIKHNLEQERVDEWRKISNKYIDDLQSIFNDILKYLESLDYNIDKEIKDE